MADERFTYSAKLRFLCGVARRPTLTRSAVAVASVLIDHTNADTMACFPAISSIVSESGVPRSTVIRSLRELERDGVMVAEKRTGSVTHYRLLTGATHGTGSEAPTGAIQNLRKGRTGATHGTDPVPRAEHEQKEKKKSNRKRELSLLTFQECLDQLAEGQRFLPLDDPLFAYVENAGIPGEFHYLAWVAFKTRFKGSTDRCSDWRERYRRAIREDWLKVWRFDEVIGEYVLTNVGQQLQRVVEAKE